MPRRKRIAGSATEVTDFHLKCPCGNCAVVYLEIHQIDYCVKGNRELGGFKCKACLIKVLARMIDILVDNGPLGCSSCGMVVAELSDLVTRIQPLSYMV